MRHEPRKGAIYVEVRESRDLERALKIFNKKVQDAGVLKEVRERMEFEKPTTIRKKKRRKAERRWEKYVEDMISSGQMKPPNAP